VGLFVAVAATIASAQEGSAPAPIATAAPSVRNLVVITLDTVRADHLGCYGYLRDTTPHIDALARDALRFTRCLAPIAQTTPSHSSLFTGVLPLEHGVLSNFFTRPDDERELHALRTSPTLQTLAQSLHAKGMKTGGFVGATPVKKFTGLAAGFDAWSEPESARRVASEVIDDAIGFVDGCAGAPFFVWVHLFDAHGPLRPPFPPQPCLERYRTDRALQAWLDERGFPSEVGGEHTGSVPPSHAHNLYDGALRFLDDQLEVLIERLRRSDLWESTAIVVVSDHGHGLGQHGYLSHGTCWDEQYRVPLLIRVPGVAPAAIDDLCATIDVVPTLFGLAPALADEALLRQIRGSNVLAADYEPRPLFGMSPIEKRMTSLTTSRWKLLRRRDRAPELFDLETDPFELKDVAAAHQDIVDRLGRLLASDIERQKRSEKLHHAGLAGMDDAGPIDPKVLDELRALGYGSDGDPEDGNEAPKDAAKGPPKDTKDQKDGA
jgi:arylsulfatase